MRTGATAFRLIAALAWKFFGWRFGGSGEATEWAKEEENGVGKDFSVDFLLDLDLVLIGFSGEDRTEQLIDGMAI